MMRLFRKKRTKPTEKPIDDDPVIINAVQSSSSDNSDQSTIDPEKPAATKTFSTTDSETPYHRETHGDEDNDPYEILGNIPKFLLPTGGQVDEKQKSALAAAAAFLLLLLIIICLSSTSGKRNLHEIGGSGVTFNPNFFFASKQTVAFVGNMNFILNDLPRLVQTISGNKITQDSCLHQKGTLLNILKTGNGMLDRWTTKNAILSTSQYGRTIYDYGSCSVPQLLLGSDSSISYRNQYGSFYDDGLNPCLNDETYFNYEVYQKNATGSWDFVILTDHAKRMSFDYSRQQSFKALNYTFAPILNQNGAKPIIVQPHAFWSNNENMTGLTDVPTFTSLVYAGAQEYKSFLDSSLSSKQTARISPVGNAFLAVYDDYPDLYDALFLSGSVHPSPIGTLLYSLCIYASVYGTMPPRSNVFLDDMSQLYSNSRKLYTDGYNGVPTQSQAKILYKIARRITLKGYKPSSLKNY